MAPSGWPKQEFESVSHSQRRKMPRSVKMDFAEGAEERPAMVSEVQWSSRDLRSSSMNLLDGERSCVRRRLIITVWLKMTTLEVNRGVLEVWQRISNFCPAGPDSPPIEKVGPEKGGWSQAIDSRETVGIWQDDAQHSNLLLRGEFIVSNVSEILPVKL
jgi:hypothetical protein